MIPDILIRKKIEEYLEEDLFYGDLTAIEGRTVHADIIVKEKAVLAGVRVSKIAFEMFGVEVLDHLNDGAKVNRGDIVMKIKGDAGKILMLERTILNIMMRMSGIATITAEMVEKAKRVNPKVIIAATRKTTPGFRMFEKMAVKIGGGDPHRFGLGDCVLIKDNHIAVLGGVVEAIRSAKKTSFTKKIEVEVKNLEEALLAAEEGVDIIMLDNFKPSDVKKAVELIKSKDPKILVEVSGGITPENVEEYARTGVDIISSGYITHSAKAIDMSLVVRS